MRYKMNSLVSFDNNESLAPNELQALNGLYGLLEHAEQQMIDRAEQTHQKSLHTFQAMKSHVDNLLLQNGALNAQLIEYESVNKQMTIALQGEVAAWQSKAEQAEKALDTLRQEMAVYKQKAQAELVESIKAKEEAVRIAVQVGDSRIAALKQQITVSLDNMYLMEGPLRKNVHKLEAPRLRYGVVQCSCHHPDDPNSYTQKYLMNNPTRERYDDFNFWTVRELTSVLAQQIETLKKIAS
jgi:hypothetical protein